MTKFEVIIIGGSYSGLAAAMGLGRALRSVLVVDNGMPANRFTPESHNFITHDGSRPSEIAAIAKAQVDKYETVERIDGQVVAVDRVDNGFCVTLADSTRCCASKLIFATGIIDIMPDIPGFAECWGKSVLHCPYCHGYEVKGTKTGILGNGEYAFEFGMLISNWTPDLAIYTNGPSILTTEQYSKLQSHDIQVVEEKIKLLKNTDGYLETILFASGRTGDIQTIYARPLFKQHSGIPEQLGCEITDDGYIKVDIAQRTTVPGIYACGDNVSRMRTVANAVSMGTTAAITVNKDFILQSFQ